MSQFKAIRVLIYQGELCSPAPRLVLSHRAIPGDYQTSVAPEQADINGYLICGERSIDFQPIRPIYPEAEEGTARKGTGPKLGRIPRERKRHEDHVFSRPANSFE